MKTKVFELGAICAAVALLVVLSLPAYAKSGGSSGAHTRVSKTPSNATSVKPVTSSRKTQLGTAQTLEKKGQAATSSFPNGPGPVVGATVSSIAGAIAVKNSVNNKSKQDGTAEYKRKNSPPNPCVGKNC
jgi:hypothetical protein